MFEGLYGEDEESFAPIVPNSWCGSSFSKRLSLPTPERPKDFPYVGIANQFVLELFLMIFSNIQQILLYVNHIIYIFKYH